MQARWVLRFFGVLWLWATAAAPWAPAGDYLRDLQAEAVRRNHAAWGHWGIDPQRYLGWKWHSNRLVPVYTFGIDLRTVAGEQSVYRQPERIRELYGQLPDGTLQPQAQYFDQTDIYRLQQQAVAQGKKHIVLVVFDGMDWQTLWAAAIYRTQRVTYREGRGTGLLFQDYRGAPTDFGFCVTSPWGLDGTLDVDAQVVHSVDPLVRGGYDPTRGGHVPWEPPASPAYLIGQDPERPHAVTDSASSATSLCSGIKTYNAAINVDARGRQVVPIARQLQREGWSVGIVTSVPISHATPAAAYANNVSRDDYQDLTRDLLGLPSVAHPRQPLPGVDVLLGAGWGEDFPHDPKQGANFVPGNRYVAEVDLQAACKASATQRPSFRLAQRTAGRAGADVLREAVQQAIARGERLLGLFGVRGGHLPYRTADGGYDPAPGVRPAESYSPDDIAENPTLADLTEAALEVLAARKAPFWLMIEAGDVDWAHHDDNLDNSIGAILCGDEAFGRLARWIERRKAWNETAVIVTSDHGHYLVIRDPEALLAPRTSP
jgi:alkaline phosphatase